jgi:hypothetical protein
MEQSLTERSKVDGYGDTSTAVAGSVANRVTEYASGTDLFEVHPVASGISASSAADKVTPTSPISSTGCTDESADCEQSPAAAECSANATMLASVLQQGDDRQQGLTLDEAAEMSQVSYVRVAPADYRFQIRWICTTGFNGKLTTYMSLVPLLDTSLHQKM